MFQRFIIVRLKYIATGPATIHWRSWDMPLQDNVFVTYSCRFCHVPVLSTGFCINISLTTNLGLHINSPELLFYRTFGIILDPAIITVITVTLSGSFSRQACVKNTLSVLTRLLARLANGQEHSGYSIQVHCHMAANAAVWLREPVWKKQAWRMRSQQLIISFKSNTALTALLPL